MVALWEGWVPGPGSSRLGREEWVLWDRYVGQIVDRVQGHDALLLVEVMNEPYMTQTLRQPDLSVVRDFLVHVHGMVMEAAPSVPLAVGAATVDELVEFEDVLGAPCDVVSFHSYATGHELEEEIARAHVVADGRPVYLSEWGYFPGGSDAHHHLGYAQRLPIVASAAVSWAAFHLVAGYGPFGLSALLYPSGIMRPGARLLHQHLRGAREGGRGGRQYANQCVDTTTDLY